MQSYITYNPNTKEITGAYLQDLPEGLENVFLVQDDVRLNWPMYEMNESLDAIVLRDVVQHPVAVPQLVTRRQARQALLLTNNANGIPLLDLVEPAIAAISNEIQRRLAQIAWGDATEFERYDALVLQIGTVLGLDEKGLDDLFVFAATL